MTEKERQEFLEDMRATLKEEAGIEPEEEHWTDLIMSDRDPYDPVSSPRHYVKGSLESIDVIEAFVPDAYSFYMGNVMKYVQRHLDKNGKQDLEKAQWYLRKMIEDWRHD